jgi:hypothetical protein
VELSVRTIGRAMLCGAAAAVAASATHAQSEFVQSSSQALGGAVSANGGVVITRLAPPGRIDVRTSVSDPVLWVSVEGHRNSACTSAMIDWPNSFRQQLFDRISAQNAAALRATLASAQTGSRAEQYRHLFGLEMPPTEGTWRLAGVRSPDNIDLTEAQQAQLNMGQPIIVNPPQHLGSLHVYCLTLPEVDALIAEAKRVYSAVIAAMEGARTGLKPSSAPQIQSPGGK